MAHRPNAHRRPAPARETLDALTTEKDFMQQVIDLARMLGWKTYHVLDSRGSTPGFPDLVIVKPGGGPVLFWELKSVGAHATADQQVWIDALGRATAVHAAVLWPCPSHWKYIEETLKEAQP